LQKFLPLTNLNPAIEYVHLEYMLQMRKHWRMRGWSGHVSWRVRVCGYRKQFLLSMQRWIWKSFWKSWMC